MNRLHKYWVVPLNRNDVSLAYFHENNIQIKKIAHLGEGDYSKTYKVTTSNGDYALNIRTETIGDYARLIQNDYTYLPKVFDVRKINNKFCIVTEVLQPLSGKEKSVIVSLDYLFFATNQGGLDIWMQDNLNKDLYLKTREIIEKTDPGTIPEHKYAPKFQWFCSNYSEYKTFIYEIQSAFQEYNKVLGYSYDDFHEDNMMQDGSGQLKLIDL